MLKTLGAQIVEFKKDSLLTPVFMILEVFMETIIPLMMASIIDRVWKRATSTISTSWVPGWLSPPVSPSSAVSWAENTVQEPPQVLHVT